MIDWMIITGSIIIFLYVIVWRGIIKPSLQQTGLIKEDKENDALDEVSEIRKV